MSRGLRSFLPPELFLLPLGNFQAAISKALDR